MSFGLHFYIVLYPASEPNSCALIFNNPIKGMILSIILLINYAIGYAQHVPEISKGMLDLTEFEFGNNPLISLDGEWEFYHQQLLTAEDFSNISDPHFVNVPGTWNGLMLDGKELSGIGYATYRLQILLPETSPPLSLEIPNVYSSYTLYVNGKLISNNGQTGIDKDSTQPEWRFETKPLTVSGGEMIELVLQVSNFHHHRGGVHKSLYLGEQGAIVRKRELSVTANGLLMGGVLVLGAFFLSFYLIRKRDIAVLYFGLFSLIWAVRVMFSNIYIASALFDDMSWTTSIKVEYISLYMSVLFGMLFINEVFSNGFKQIFVNTVTVINFLFIFLTTILSPYHFTTLLPVYQLFILANVLLSIIILVRAAKKGQPEVWYSITGILLGMSLVILELVSYYYELQLSIVTLSLGYLSVFFLNSLVLAHRFVDAFNEVQRLEQEQRRHLSKV